jgi:hypothetical protein
MIQKLLRKRLKKRRRKIKRAARKVALASLTPRTFPSKSRS